MKRLLKILAISTLVPTILSGAISTLAHAQKIRRFQPQVTESSVEDHLKIADELFNKQLYYAAIDHYNKVIEQDTSEVLYSYYQLGEAYRILRLYKKAVENYNILLEDKSFAYLQSDFPLALFWYGKMLKANGEYDKAQQCFQKVIENYDENAKNPISLFIKRGLDREIKSCEFAQQLMANPTAEVSNLGNNINKPHSDFAAINVDSVTLLFTSALQLKKKQKLADAQFDTIFVNRLFEANKQGKSSSADWNERGLLDINPESDLANIGSSAFSVGQQRLYFTICENIEKGTDCNIYYTFKNSNKWAKPIKLQEPVNSSDFSSKHPMVVADAEKTGDYDPIFYGGGEILFFSSDRKGGSGGFDIWYCKMDANKNLSTPVNLGDKINTQDDEVTPFFDVHSDVLYFSSNGHLGLGEFDIFMVNFITDHPDIGSNELSEPIYNIGYPINSSADDYYFYLSSGGRSGYFTSNRAGGYSKDKETCCDDIYAFRFEESFIFEKLAKYRSKRTLLEEEEDFGFHLSDFLAQDDDITLSGTLKQNDTVLPNTWVMLINKKGDIIDSTLSDEYGNFTFERLSRRKNYFVMLDEEEIGTFIEVNFMDKEGELLLSVNSDDVGALFKYEKLDRYRSKRALLEEDHDFGFNLADLLTQDDDLTISGIIKQNDRERLNIIVMLLNEGGYVIDSTKADNEGKFKFERLSRYKNYFVLLDEKDIDLYIELDFIDEEGTVLLSVNSNTTKGLFKFEKLDKYYSEWALLEEILAKVKFEIDLEEELSEKYGLDTLYEKIYELENVYFDLNKADLRPDSYSSLTQLYNAMKENKKMVIEIAGHTDKTGKEEHNVTLSQQRAEIVRAYLLKREIDVSRLTAKGYGATQPVADEDTEAGSEKNRRVEIRILSQ